MLVKLYSALGAVSHAVSPQMDSIGYWEKNALQAMGAQGHRIANYEQDSEILGQIQNIYNAENMKQPPMVIIYKQDIPNAAFIHTGTIVISTGLIKRLDKDEREGVLAHEITHQQQNKVNLSAFVAYAVGSLVATVALTNRFMKKIPEKFNNSFVNYVSFGVIGAITNFITSIPFLAHKRHQEYAADSGSARITRKPEKLISALRKLEKYPEEKKHKQDEIPKTDVALSAVAIHNHTAPSTSAFGGEITQKLYATHPSTDSRVERLEKIRDEQIAEGTHHSQRN